MISGLEVLLVTKEDATANMASSALGASKRIALGGIYQEVSELRVHLSRASVQAVVVDIDPDPSGILHGLGVIAPAHPEILFVVVSSKSSEELILEAMQAGVRHFLRKESLESELGRVLERLLCADAKRASKLGSIISVFSASGGCGATTVALNLSNELRLESSRPVLVIDLDRCYGTVSAYLGIRGQYGIADVLDRKGPIDEHLIRSSAYNYMEDFHVLISPPSFDGGAPKLLQHKNLTNALEACRHAYKYTVVDAPRVAESIAADLAVASDFALVVFQLTVKDLKFAQSIVSFLVKRGISRERILPLANRCKRRSPLVRLEDSKQVLGVDSVHRIRSDWRKAMGCVNHGQPLANVAPRSGLRRDFRALAAKIHTYEANDSGMVLG